MDYSDIQYLHNLKNSTNDTDRFLFEINHLHTKGFNYVIRTECPNGYFLGNMYKKVVESNNE
jgi:hypothetical protein